MHYPIITRFAALQDALAEGARNKLTFYAFDLLHLDGWDLTGSFDGSLLVGGRLV